MQHESSVQLFRNFQPLRNKKNPYYQRLHGNCLIFLTFPSSSHSSLGEGREIVWIQWHADQIGQIAHMLPYYGWISSFCRNRRIFFFPEFQSIFIRRGIFIIEINSMLF